MPKEYDDPECLMSFVDYMQKQVGWSKWRYKYDDLPELKELLKVLIG